MDVMQQSFPRFSAVVCLMMVIGYTPYVHGQQTDTKPVRIAVAGISHGHVPWMLNRHKPDMQLVGVWDSNNELAQRYAQQFRFDAGLIYTDLEKMLDMVKPEAVVAFGSIYQHLQVVEACAPRGIHVMVEKPLAVSLEHANRMVQLAQQYHIHLLTNFETSWYPTTVKAFQLVNDSAVAGPIRKVVVHDGHPGPKEIGVSPEFFEWLTDPVQNGGGALIDFGCYGANLATYLMNGQQPLSVTAVTQQVKPAIYPKVDDEATIILTYPEAQCIIQASWNWPFSRKDMEVYGKTGYVIADDATQLRIRTENAKAETRRTVTAEETGVYTDPFSYFADVIRNKITVPENGVYALSTNLTVVKILEAARTSAMTGKTVHIAK